MTSPAFIRFGHGYETGSLGRCEAFDGFDIIANPLGGFDNAARESRVFRWKGPSGGTDYGSHSISLATRSDGFASGLYILIHHGGGREVLALPTFYDGGALTAALLALPEREQYALLYTIWSTARNAREEAQANTRREWAQAHVEKRIKVRRATKLRGARVEIVAPSPSL